MLECITGKGVVELAHGCLEDSVDKCEPGVSKAGWCVERGSGHIDRTRLRSGWDVETPLCGNMTHPMGYRTTVYPFVVPLGTSLGLETKDT